MCTHVCSAVSGVSDSLHLMDYKSPGSSVHGILQARILEWVAMPFSRGSSQPRDGTPVSYVSCIGRQVLYHQLHPGSPWFPQWSPKLSTEIKTLNVRALSFSFIERRRTINQETASWRALRNCPKEVSGEVSVYVILAKGVHISRHTSQQKVAASHEDQISSLMVLVLVQLWKDARIQVHRKFS